MVLVCHPAHRLGTRRVVMPGEAIGEKFVAFDADLEVRNATDRSLKRPYVKVNVAGKAAAIVSVVSMVNHALGGSPIRVPTPGCFDG